MVSQNRPVFAVVLAAGRGRRFGCTKQLVEIEGQPMVRRSCAIAREACGENTVLVTGHDSGAVLRAAGDSVGFVVVNDRHADGLGSSIATAARSLAHTAGGILLLFVDQPLISAAHLHALLTRWQGGERDIVATAFANTLGPPVLFPRGAFADLAALSGDRGARSLLRDSRFDVCAVEFEAAAIDIDTMDQLESLPSSAARRPPEAGA